MASKKYNTPEEKHEAMRLNYARYAARHPERRKIAKAKQRYGFVPPPMPKACEACSTPFVQFEKGGCVDHDHVTGEFRGWLCSPCNTALGHAKDSRDRLQLLINYLDRYELLR